MRKSLSIALALLTSVAIGANSFSVKNNSDIALTLSSNNYNRIVVKDDRIMNAIFLPETMGIQQDEKDGSVYVVLKTNNPFTLFLTTENGRHFSVTLNGEESLGKTIELVPSQPVTSKIVTKTPSEKPKNIAPEAVPEAILAMLSHMEQQTPFADVRISRQWGGVERWKKGLTLLPKEYWDGKLLRGERIELYNGGKEPIELMQEWFAKENTLAVKFSKNSIAPGEKVMLYRVQGVNHG